MKKHCILFSLAIIFLSCSLAQGANRVVVIPLNSSSPVYVVGQEITSLPATISSPGFYFITKDLTSSSAAHGINITVDNVTLDLMGFSLIGPDSHSESTNGIHMEEGRSNVEIRNGTVRNFPGNGIYEPSSAPSTAGHRILDMRIIGNGKSGIRMVGANHIVERCTVWGNDDDGITTGVGSKITGNVCYKNKGNGIYTDFGSTVTNNSSYSNGAYGIYLTGNCYADQNCAYGNAGPANMNTTGCSTCTFGSNHAP